MPESILHLSSLIGAPLLDSAGGRLGRIEDVVARLDMADGTPPVVGLKAKIGGREMFVPAHRIDRLEPGAAHVSTTKLNLAQFERRTGEVLLRADVLDRSLINVEEARLVKAREVDLVCKDGAWRVAGIDPSFDARLRRLLPRRYHRHEDAHGQFLSWNQMEAFVGHVPTSRLKLPVRRIARLHPAQIADLVEAASHDEGEEIMAAVGQDKELEADVFEELDDEHQAEFLKERSDEEAAAILGRMEPDDAADLLLELDQDRRLSVLNLLPAAKQRKIRKLLGFNPSTAGGLMNPDFFSAPASASIAETLARMRSSELDPDQLLIVWVVDAVGRLAGGVYLSEMMIAGNQEDELSNLIETPLPVVTPDTDVPELSLLMSDYNLTGMPVVDQNGRPIGVVSVDDLLEQLLPEEWRRRSGAARG